MLTLYLHIKAPFAAFRWHQAGNYRASARVIPPSAAWGLLLNLAGVESRAPQSPKEVTTQIRKDAPKLKLAIGLPTREVEVSALYQQLHHYPVGNSSKDFKERARGAKYHVSPTWREVLVGFEAVIAFEADAAFMDRIRRGLAGEWNAERYGTPFLGDNNFILDHAQLHPEPPMEVYWYEKVSADAKRRHGTSRLTVSIDRSDSAHTTIPLFAPTEHPQREVPASAWVTVPGD